MEYGRLTHEHAGPLLYDEKKAVVWGDMITSILA